MKKRGMTAVAVAVCVLAAALLLSAGRKPYRDLQAGDVASATVHAAPPGKTVSVPEIGELVSRLNALAVYRKDASFAQYCGQAVTVTLTMMDGSRQEIVVLGNLALINGTGYRAKYGPCEELSRYANELLRSAGP